MPFTISPHKPLVPSKSKLPPDVIGSRYATEEIGAYIAIRDGLLAEAERKANAALLDRVKIANELVENCLKPARSPYQMQFLSEPEAKRERARCSAAKTRIAALQAALA
jgi:hypothetical protein